tara:strand:+ start:63 stop:2150 length:2088 start_codon:yes stop_codon:yes gene_type:complete
MQKLQLYLGSDRIDLFGDETVSVTQTIQNVRDIAKVFTDFSKSFSVPASKKNNLIFQHYYNFDIVRSTPTPALNKVAGKIELNSLTFKSGFFRLEGVDLKKNKAYAYRITFFGSTVNLKDLLGEDLLSGLEGLSLYDLPYTPTEVKDRLQLEPSFSSTIIFAPLITHTQRLFYNSSSSNQEQGNLYYVNGQQHGVLWNDLKYAIKVFALIDLIESQYGIVFDNSFFYNGNAVYDRLSMWLHRKSGAVSGASQVQEFSTPVSTFPIISNTYTGFPNNSVLVIFSPQSLNPQFPNAPTTVTTNTLSVTTSSSIDYQVRVFQNGQLFFQSQFASSQNVARVFTKTDMGVFSAGSSYTVSVVQQNTTSMTFTSVVWNIQGFQSTTTFNNTYQIPSPGFSTTTAIDFVISQQIPEMKVIDFLTGIFSLFNLTAFSDDGVNISVKTIDQFYSGNTVYNIDQYLEISKSTVDVALPFKQVNFEYEGLGTFLAKQYEQLNNVGWGTLKYTLDSAIYDAPSKIYNVKAPFEHMQMERLQDQNLQSFTDIQYGYFVNENQQPYFGKPLLFYPIKITSGTPISYRTDATTHQSLNVYNIPSNSIGLSLNFPFTSNINFGSEINEYNLTSEGYDEGSLFQQEYVDYVSDIFNSKRRITKVKAFLPLRIMIALTLRDKIEMRGQKYIINSVTTNLQTGESDFELLNVI